MVENKKLPVYDEIPQFTKEDYSNLNIDDELDLYKGEAAYQYYRNKYEIAKRFKPHVIGEIGVRRGHSAWSFLKACPDAEFYGFDDQSGRCAGVEGHDLSDYVQMLLEGQFFEAKVLMHRVNTMNIMHLGEGFDFIHIDGNHAYRNCFHDLVISLYSLKSVGGVLLVDDYRNPGRPFVTKAVDEFIRLFAPHITVCEHMPSEHGECIIQRGAMRNAER